MSATETYQELLTGKSGQNDADAEEIYKNSYLNWGFTETKRGGTKVVPWSEKMLAGGREEAPAEGEGWSSKAATPEAMPASQRGYSKAYVDKVTKGLGGGENPNVLLQAAKAGTDYTPGSSHALEGLDKAIESQKSIIDASIVQGATPIQFDPRVVDVQRATATILTRIAQQGQPGFQASYNVISGRSDPIGMVNEATAADLTSENDGDFTMPNEKKDMKIYVDKATVSDFTARAEDTLNYMNVADTTMGQRVIAHALFKAQQYFYGDPSVGASDGSVEDSNAYEGMAKIATDASNQVDKSGVTLSGDQPLLEDLKYELTKQVEETGLMYPNAEIAVSPTFFDRLENEANVSTRTSAFDENINFGGRQITLKQNVQVVECPNIRDYPSQSTTNFTPSNTDVFIYDKTATQFRALMPFTAVPLGRRGLAERTALGEFGTLIDKSQGEHLLYLSSYPAA